MRYMSSYPHFVFLHVHDTVVTDAPYDDSEELAEYWMKQGTVSGYGNCVYSSTFEYVIKVLMEESVLF